MEEQEHFEFVVDEQYENEKGVFTVLSIQRTEMVIRWESGEEMRTDIELQRNIQSRREWEKLQLEKEAKAAKSGRKSGARAAAFEGFKETDFKNSASGTKWRGRNQLGGSVTHRLPEARFVFNSWAFANKPEMHWLDITHQKRRSGDNRARFFVRVDPEIMYAGFGVGQSKGEEEGSRNWGNFIQWLEQDDNATTFHTLVLGNGMTIQNRNNPDGKALVPVKGGWQVGDAKKKHANDKIIGLIEKLATDGEINMEVTKRVTKKDALATGKDIALDIAELFSQISPLYEASLSSMH